MAFWSVGKRASVTLRVRKHRLPAPWNNDPISPVIRSFCLVPDSDTPDVSNFVVDLGPQAKCFTNDIELERGSAYVSQAIAIQDWYVCTVPLQSLIYTQQGDFMDADAALPRRIVCRICPLGIWQHRSGAKRLLFSSAGLVYFRVGEQQQ
jgi:hypothetical protein